MRQRAARGFVLFATAVLLGGPVVAPQLPPAWIPVLSVAWLGISVAGIVILVRALHRQTGWFGSGLALLVIGAIVVMLGGDWSGRAGTFLPCRRNWTWLPSWMLRSSPTRSLTFEVGATRVKICYGSPRTRGRRMIGGPQVPFGHLWRTGANEPFTIRADGPITVAGIPMTEGKASLYTVPGPETWEIILNGSTGQWGIESEYTESIRARELGRTVVPIVSTDTPIDPFSVTVEPTASPSAVILVLAWETTLVRLRIAEGRD